MKHIFVYLAVAALIFSYIGANAASQMPEEPSFLPVARIAAAVAEAPVEEEQAEPIQAGILLECADDVETARFKNSFEKNLGEEASVHTLDAAGNSDTQQVMFLKMLDENYSVIVVDLADAANADFFAEAAVEKDIPLIFIGAEPDAETLNKGEKLYYIGFSDYDPVEVVAQEIVRIWNLNQDVLDYRPQNVDVLAYSAFTTQGMENSGNKETFEGVLAEAEIETELMQDSETRYYDYDLYDVVDDSLYDKSELFLCDRSVDAQKIVDYFDDPLEFATRPLTQLVVLSMDDGARQLVESGKVLIACGSDSNELGASASRLAKLLVSGEAPDESNMDLEAENGRYFYLPYTLLTGDIPPAEEEA